MTDNVNQIARVALGFSRVRAANLVEFVRNIVTLMKGNANFPTPFPTLGTITTAVDQYDSLVQEASNGDRIVIKARNASRASLLSLMRQLASYVQGQCAGDVAILVTSGFKAIKQRSTSVIPGVPTNPRLTPGTNSGTLDFRFGRTKNASNFSVQLADDSAGPWTDWGLSSKSKVTLDDLTPLKTKWARARANGAAGASDWTEPTCRIVI